ncbi:putative transcriptional regulator [Heterostelium album PN500]|uniref:Putative transcriptional regulator n=1 Tax=Heterostelium pallidum (strain ATCC 26659 / Pp 5 / PN500) TaxID=670386 RepID=D3AWV2_HETP5|nr:putative transcriptional regulator [Heterostelium album PN500]EFA86775.1 putative transcriptional regulator [Heterostelium album PN500]|eukprot:XP_020438879.1 putative transcriptional regulator [Heterostelium album PN500]
MNFEVPSIPNPFGNNGLMGINAQQQQLTSPQYPKAKVEASTKKNSKDGQFHPTSPGLMRKSSPLIGSPLGSSMNTHHHNNLLSQKPGSKIVFSQYLEIVEQECISVENVILNNRNSNVHIVVKNTSFVLKIRSLDLSAINFTSCHVKAGLYYANEPMKEVSFIQTPPITYVGSSCPAGEYFTIDIKISILSSQHQGNMFYVMLHAIDSGNKNASHYYLSHPIRVVSKVDHIKKDPNGSCEKKQTFIDILTDRLNTLESIHVGQSNILCSMLKQRGLPASEYSYSELDPLDINSTTSSPPSSPFVLSAEGTPIANGSSKLHHKKLKQQQQQQQQQQEEGKSSNKKKAEQFLDSFNNVIRVYKKENLDSKKLNFLENLTNDERNILSDLLDSFTFDDPIVKNHQSNSQSSSTSSSFNLSSFNVGEEYNCQCTDCPYRKQAEQLILLSPIMSFHSPIQVLTPSTPRSPSETPLTNGNNSTTLGDDIEIIETITTSLE